MCRYITAGLLWLLLAALGGNVPDTVGIYALTRVGDSVLPALWQETELADGGRLRSWWVGGQAELRADQTYQVSLTIRNTGPGVLGAPVVMTAAGTWRLRGGGRLELRPDRGGMIEWHLSGDTLVTKARVSGLVDPQSPISFVFVRSHH
jgi:hypothetical protein